MNDKLTHTVLVLRESDSVWAEGAKDQVLESVEAIHAGLAEAGYTVVPLQIPAPQSLPSQLKPYDPRECLVFNCFEGIEAGAEDGIQIAQGLDQLGFTYTGADALAIQAAQDKLRAQRTLSAHAFPIPQSLELTQETCRFWGKYPAIVKIANEHGSESLTKESIVHDERGLQKRAKELNAAGFDRLMVSEFIDGREFTVSLWGNGNLYALPLLEVDYSAYSASYPHIRSTSAKWETHSPEYQLLQLAPPQDLTLELQSRIESIARYAYQTLRLRDYGRIDIRLRDGIPYVIDVNCNPDLEKDGSFTIAAEHGGYAYSAMLGQIMQFANHRHNGTH